MINIEALRKAAHARHEAETGAFINANRISVIVTVHYTDGTVEVMQ